MRRDHDRFGAAGLHVVAVGQGTPAEAARFQRRLKLPYAVLADPERAAFRAYGLREGTVGEVAGAGAVVAFVRALLRGDLPGRVVGNALQLHGEFLIDREGIVRYTVRPTRSSDIPSTQALIDAARDLM
ncbi:MAG: AhpC/TSA family protein [Chloroflexia bacterium]|nr:AhpC/TSA family protein [Chloroflexia bacterium]